MPPSQEFSTSILFIQTELDFSSLSVWLFPAHLNNATYLNRLDLNMKLPLVHKYHPNSSNCESFISVRVSAALDLIKLNSIFAWWSYQATLWSKECFLYRFWLDKYWILTCQYFLFQIYRYTTSISPSLARTCNLIVIPFNLLLAILQDVFPMDWTEESVDTIFQV